MRNALKVFVLMAALTALLGAIGSWLGGTTGVVVAIALAAALNLATYWWSGPLALRAYGARIVSDHEAPALHALVDRLRRRAGLPMPRVAIAPHAQPNAFASGRGPATGVVCVTDGLLRTLGREELEAVVAHELAHIRNRDVLLMTVAATIAGAIGWAANLAAFGALDSAQHDEEGEAGGWLPMLLGLLLAPLAAMVVQLAISRQREYEADRVGAEICERPLALAGALRRLDEHARAVPMQVAPAAAPLAQVTPHLAGGGALVKLFSTHPPTAERVARLEAMAARGAPVLVRHGA